jgi:hypothetical protein
VLAHSEPEVARGESLLMHYFEVETQLIYRVLNVSVLRRDILVDPNPAKVGVPVAVAEPTGHLHQGVVGTDIAMEVADHQSVECQPAAQNVATHRDHSRGLVPDGVLLCQQPVPI